MRFVSLSIPAFLAASLATLSMACSGGASSSEEASPVESVGTNYESFEQFEKSAFREPETGFYIVNGDQAIDSVKALKEFHAIYVEGQNGGLIVNKNGGSDDKWDASERKNLSYCVSDRFGSRKSTVVQAMAAATGAWEQYGDVKFIYKADQDANCTASNSNVVFDVNPVNVNGQYIARAFFPSQGRSSRNVLIDNSAFSNNGDPSVTGVLRHELGHALGFRHEHTRPESGTCFEDNNWRVLTTYDKASVMHYPQCNGVSSWALNITQKDVEGIQALYGAPGGGGGGTTGGTTGGTSGGTTGTTTGGTTGGGTPQSETVSGSVTAGEFDQLGYADVVPGTIFQVNMTGTGDPDLYVRFGSQPTTSSYNCRPYVDGATEQCRLTVPNGVSKAYVGVRGYKAGSYTLKIQYTQP